MQTKVISWAGSETKELKGVPLTEDAGESARTRDRFAGDRKERDERGEGGRECVCVFVCE